MTAAGLDLASPTWLESGQSWHISHKEVPKIYSALWKHPVCVGRTEKLRNDISMPVGRMKEAAVILE